MLARESGLNKKGGRDLEGWESLDETIPRREIPKNLHYLCMTQYDKLYELPLVIPPESLDNILANVLAAHQLRNLRVAETEKFAHVTYFFNGGIETPFPGEDRVLIPSLKVATYDLAPEMKRRGHRRHHREGRQRHRLRPDRRQLRQRRHGGPLRQAGADHQGLSRPSTRSWAASTRPSRSGTAAG